MTTFGAFGGGAPTFGTTGPGSYQQSGFGEYADLFQPPQGVSSPGSGYNYNPATGMYQFHTGQTMSNPFGGVTYQQAGDPASLGMTPGMQQFQSAALQDYMNLMNANMMNYGNFMNQMGQVGQTIQEGTQNILNTGQEGFDFLTGQASQMSDLGGEIAEGIRQTADDAYADFENRAAQDASSINAGMQMAQRNNARFQELAAAAKMGDPQAIAERAQFELNSSIAMQQNMTQFASQYNKDKAMLGMQRSSAYGQAGQVQLGFEAQSQALNQQAVTIQNAAASAAADYAARGHMGMAELYANNPFSPVAFLDVITTFFSFGMAEGSGSFPGLSQNFLDNLEF